MRKLAFLIVAALMLGGCANPVDSLRELIPASTNESSIDDEQAGRVGKKDGAAYDDYFLEKSWKYAYDGLSDAQKIWYKDVERALANMVTDAELSKEGVTLGLNEKDLEHIFICVCMDHPEFFYVEGFSYVTHVLGDQVLGYSFSGNYGVSREEAIRRKGEIQAATDAILKNAPKDADDYEKIKYVYETLIRQTEYSMDAPDNQSIYSALVGKESVCQGYSKSMQYLLGKLGVDCTLVQGAAMGQSHGWNLVKADGDYYYVDVTWGDNSYHPSEIGLGTTASPEILYEYLLVTTEEILKEHQIDEIVPLPKCVNTRDNYFVREEAYFTELNEAKLRVLFSKASFDNAWQVSLKCATPECFHEILNFLLGQNKIFDYYPTQGSRVSYYQNEDLLCLTFWVTN